MKILIVNQPLNNRGDESAHKGLVRTLLKEFPSAEIKVLFVGANPDSVNQFSVKDSRLEYINIPSFKLYYKFSTWGVKYSVPFLWWIHPTCRKVIEIYKRTDFVICAPGGICMGGFQSWTHLYFLKTAQYTKKKLMYYGRSFGPFPTITRSNRTFKKVSLEMLHYFSFLSIRDKKTEDLAKTLGLNYFHTVDSAFLDEPNVHIPKEISQMIGSNDYMVFVPNLLIWHYAYKHVPKEIIFDFYEQIYKCITETHPELNIVMLPQTFNYNNYLGDDINFFRELKERINSNKIKLVPDTYSSDIQQSLIKSATFLIGARYHSVVFAINNNIPFVALSYEHKISGLLINLDKTDSMIDISRFFDNYQENILSLKKELLFKLKNLEPDSKARSKAKDIANQCFRQFQESIKNQCNLI